MANYILSRQADEDIARIYTYSFHQFGEYQADKYIDGLISSLHLIVANPSIGRLINHIRAGYRVFDHEQHAIYYHILEQEVMIVRVLHKRMLTLPNNF